MALFYRPELAKSVEEPKIYKPLAFSGKGSVASWVNQMENYSGSKTDESGIHIALNYLRAIAHK